MSETTGPKAADGSDHARTLFWRELVQLKVDCEYTQTYRDQLSRLLTIFEVGRAVVSGGALGSWVAGLGYPKVWALIIVMSQSAEAIMAKLPLTARQKNLAAFGVALDTLLIDALLEWESIQAEDIPSREITRRWHTLMKLRHDAETKHQPGSIPYKKALYLLAERAAADYFQIYYRTK